MNRRNEYDDIFIVSSSDSTITGLDVIHHDRERREIKWHIVAKWSIGRDRHMSTHPFVDERNVSNIYVIWIGIIRSLTMQPSMVQNPGHIRDVNNAKDPGELWIQ